MDRVRIDLKNCYGIKNLEREFDFTKARAYAIYAPNGVMKSSLALTFQDAVGGADSSDRIFPKRKTVRKLLDETNQEIDGGRILVVLPYNPQFGITEKTSTLLIDPNLREEYEKLVRATIEAKRTLLDAIRKQSGSKKNLEVEISRAFIPADDEFDTALIRIKRELEEQKDAPFADVQYDTIFNDKVGTALKAAGLTAAIEEYVRRYNELLSKSTYFKKGTFDYYNAGQIAKSLARKLPRLVDSSKLESPQRAVARGSVLAAGFPARRAA